jgi:hypothetical protein
VGARSGQPNQIKWLKPKSPLAGKHVADPAEAVEQLVMALVDSINAACPKAR